MKLIDEDMVEATWEEVGAFTPRRANQEMTRVGQQQPELLGFLMASTEELDQEVIELGIYLFFNLYRMFETNCPSKSLPRISGEQIMACYDENLALLESLQGAHGRFIDRAAEAEGLRQPHVMRYVAETLIEMPEDEDSIPLNEDSMGHLFLVLKTLVDVLDRSVAA